MKEVALEEALQNVKKLPKEIRAMLEDDTGSVKPAAEVKKATRAPGAEDLWRLASPPRELQRLRCRAWPPGRLA